MRELDGYKRHIRDYIGFQVKSAAAKRLFALALAFALALPLVVLGAIPAPAGAQATTPAEDRAALRLPDLRMGPLQDLKIRRLPDGRRLLRFSALMVNVGAGPFEVHGSRDTTSSPEITEVTQRIFNSSGGYTDHSTDAHMFYSGDGHDHWHIADLERYTLKRLGGSSQVREGAKQGFCVYDFYPYNLTLRGAPKSKHYTTGNTCGLPAHEEALQVDMGLSVGWTDKYGYYLPLQWIDITGLRLGTYRLYAVADAEDQFEEQREANNYTWSKIELKPNKAKVLKEGPVARYCGRNGRYC